ncbi:MAG TPA: GYD domain-containing protein [Gaiellaceae bacterium]|nr:GYD domain-containing protein [Gaiellaceae bacterium]
MPTFILLSTLTHQGVQTLKSNPERLRQVNKDVEELGCRVLHQWATLGEFDFVNVVEAPDLETVAKVSVALSARGSTRIETLPALEVDEFLRTLE